MISKNLLLAALATVSLSACDAPKPVEAPVAKVEAVPTPPPPKPLDPATVVTQIDHKVLCSHFLRAGSDAKTKIPKGDCVVTTGTQELTIATPDATHTLTVPLVEEGTVIQLTAANASPRAIASADGFQNIGMVFVGRAPAAGLCMSIEYIAADGSSNSVFVTTDPTKESLVFGVPMSPTIATARFATPVIPAGQIAAFALTRREPLMVVKSASFKAC